MRIRSLLIAALLLLPIACTPAQAARFNQALGRVDTDIAADAAWYTETLCTQPHLVAEWIEFARTTPQYILGDENVADCPLPPSIEEQIRAAFPEDQGTALAIARCESHYDPYATGSYGERGLFQIHPVHRNGVVADLGYTWDQMYEVGPNIDVARVLYLDSGWRPWTCRNLI